MELVLATGNRDKQREMKAFLQDLRVTIRTPDEFPGAPVVVEDGETCRANAGKKAREISQFTGLLTLADDTGLEVDALGGRPGVYAARYAGAHASYEDNCRKLLDELDGVPWDQRGARFLTVVAISDPSSSVEFVEGALQGRIADHCSGMHGFGYDPVFIIPELGKTLAELTLDQKNQISHRGQALAKAKDVLKRRLVRNIGA
ncbi:MAG: XTP/dITP diphosphatase [Nitrospira sp. SB0677_bin_15]|nr:XTP/dITP diphosphatase [Nitrospira sp. SB0661_bin_20]MYG41308.1 XTP/dITP diphosphatase [Nitrospira sp. SB0677_bin_15]MYH02915.1 XTP/dITP diphosphatase [Nitrospira sp. SB0675_bin_23]